MDDQRLLRTRRHVPRPCDLVADVLLLRPRGAVPQGACVCLCVLRGRRELVGSVALRCMYLAHIMCVRACSTRPQTRQELFYIERAASPRCVCAFFCAFAKGQSFHSASAPFAIDSPFFLSLFYVRIN